MKPERINLLGILLAAIISVLSQLPNASAAGIITQWRFNNSVMPTEGSGTVSLIGGTSASFATGSTNDPSSTGNTGWNTTHYPAQGAGNRTAGLQFAASTLGYSDIVVGWDHRVSSTASKYCRFQYSLDGTNFIEAPSLICARQAASTASYYEPQSMDLTGVLGVEDNPAFAFRIVTEFESTALGTGTEEYVTTYGTNRYSSAGTIRFDMVTVTGNHILGSNLPPEISPIADQTVRVRHGTGPMAFTVSDPEDAPEHLVIGCSSSSPAVVPETNIVLSGVGSQRSVEVIAGDQPGVASISLKVTDSGGRSSLSTFNVSVLPLNTVPFISSISGTNLVFDDDHRVVLPFTIADLETAADSLSVTGQSGNPALVPNNPAHLSMGGTGSNRFVVVAPSPGVAGAALIIISVSDGVNSSQSSFPLAVTPDPACVLFEPFNYPDGPLVTNSGFLWANRSGTPGDCEVTNRQLGLSPARTEGVVVPIPGAPFAPGFGQILYASFRFKFLGTPDFTPEFFACFFGAGSSRARVYAGATDVWPGAFRLFVANGTSASSTHAAVLSSNTFYTAVIRYNLDLATTALWVNPASESTPAAVAIDTVAPVSITAFGFRQENRLGATVLIDDLKAGLSFAAVTGSNYAIPRLYIQQESRTARLWWVDPEFFLQAAANPGGPFTNLIGATSPFTNTADHPALFFRLYRAP